FAGFFRDTDLAAVFVAVYELPAKDGTCRLLRLTRQINSGAERQSGMTEQEDSYRWYVLQTKPRQEVRAELNLHRWRIETLAPKLLQPNPSGSGGASYRAVPLFPGYLFARFDATAVLGKIRLTRGIQRVVGFGECATPLDP